jgi:hypothetical protein
VAGSLAAGFLLLPVLGLGASVLLVAGLYGTLAAVAWLRSDGGARRWVMSALPLVAVAAWALFGPGRIHLQPLEPGERLLLYRDGEAASVAVIGQEDGARSLKLNHAYLLGSSGAAGLELRQGRLPLLLHPAPKRVAFIGVATGITARAVLTRLAAVSRPDPFLKDPSGLLLLFLADSDALRAWADGAPLNTDDRPFIEFATPGSLLRHRQRGVDEVQRELARFRPRVLPGAEALALARPAPEVFALADLLQDATLAHASLRFERELRILEELAHSAGELEAVRFAVSQAAEELRRRGHVARTDALLRSLGNGAPGGG